MLQTILRGIATVLFLWPYRVRWILTMLIVVGGSFATLSIKNIDFAGLQRGSSDPLGLSLGLDLVGGIHLVYQTEF